ncbi:hypothetical protein MBLNU457_1639t1 [Dothideomycetes sp. NU457]
MPSSNIWKRQICLTLANLLIPLACLVFATGFFPYKPFLAGLATHEQILAEEELGLLGGSGAEVTRPARVFDKVIFMVVDALRSDFVYGNKSGFHFTQSLIRDGTAIPYTAHAAPPTVTMPRVKGLTTGSVPSFVDLILNFAESDTSSSLATQDTWLAQIRSHLHPEQGEGRLVFYGDDTWLKLFPDFFAEHDGTSSFFVSDFTEVDNNVTRHLPESLASSNWDAMVMHYLGLDHIGHKTGPEGPNMPAKQREMDSIVKQIYTAIETNPHLENTVLILAGDHGMNSGGNHGGSAPGETSTALLFASPKLQSTTGKRPALTAPIQPKEKTEFDFYRKIEQSDLVPTISALLGVPFPKNNLGVVVPELLEFWRNDNDKRITNPYIQVLYRNSLQVLNIVKATYGEDEFKKMTYHDVNIEGCSTDLSGRQLLSCLWARAQSLLLKSQKDGDISAEEQVEALRMFLEESQDELSTTASTYNVPRLVSGALVAGVATILALIAIPLGVFNNASGMLFSTMTVLYGIMMFATSYVEEEQHFWYWTTGAWFAFLTARALSKNKTNQRLTLACSTALLALHRVMTRWNQTGQKWAGAPDISRTFFPENTYVLWILIVATYAHLGVKIVRNSLIGQLPTTLAVCQALVSVLPALTFKLNFAAADAPELVGSLGIAFRNMTDTVSLVSQARTAFVSIAVLTFTIVVGMRNLDAKARSTLPTMAERLHTALTLFLVTQSRVNNVPLFLIFDGQLQLLSYLILSGSSPSLSPAIKNHKHNLIAIISTTTLVLSYTTYFALGGSNAISSIDLSNAYNGISGYNIGAVGVLLFVGNWAGSIWWCCGGILLLHRARRLLSASDGGTPSTQPPASEAYEHGPLVKALNYLVNTGAQAAADPKQKDWIQQEHAYLATSAKKIPEPNSSTYSPSSDPQSFFLTHYGLQTLFTTSSLTFVMVACTLLRTHLFIWTVFSPKFLYAMAWGIGVQGIVFGLLGGLWWGIGF